MKVKTYQKWVKRTTFDLVAKLEDLDREINANPDIKRITSITDRSYDIFPNTDKYLLTRAIAYEPVRGR